MKRINFRKNEKAQVLGLPMYLIIIMIIAIVVIAAVIFMMPKGTQKIKAEVTTGFLFSSTAGSGGDKVTLTGSTGTITVNDMDGNPISGARVTLTDSGASFSGTTSGDGTCPFTIDPILESNIDKAFVTLRVKADGYDDFEDLHAIELVRIY